MKDLFTLSVNKGSGDYGFTDTFNELLEDVEEEFGAKVKSEVRAWAEGSNEGDTFQKQNMIIINIGLSDI